MAGLLGFGSSLGFASDSPASPATVPPNRDFDLEEVLARIEKRYSGPGFSALFIQASTIKAMGITDTASGRIFIKRPDKMRWEYETPERQTIITDGVQLWMYRPDDKQVMVGRAPTFFGGGKGAGFLADMQNVRSRFTITPAESTVPQTFGLKLIPVKPQAGLADIYLSVSTATYEVVVIITHNDYEDETRIELSEYQFGQAFDDALFRFETPAGVDVLQLDQE
jgi:outer membrane lipoprotein carrier protein